MSSSSSSALSSSTTESPSSNPYQWVQHVLWPTGPVAQAFARFNDVSESKNTGGPTLITLAWNRLVHTGHNSQGEKNFKEMKVIFKLLLNLGLLGLA